MPPKNDPLAKALNESASEPINTEQAREIETLKEALAEKGRRLDILEKIANGNVRGDYSPSEERLQAIWTMAYEMCLDSVIKLGLSYYNTKPKVLQASLQLAAIRADEAVEAYIAVRKVSPDPVKKELQAWQRPVSKLDKALAE